MTRFLAACRYLLVVPVVGCVILTAGVVIMGVGRIATAGYALVSKGDFSAKAAKIESLAVIEIIDLFLIGTVAYIAAAGLYKLFISGSEVQLPIRLKINTLQGPRGQDHRRHRRRPGGGVSRTGRGVRRAGGPAELRRWDRSGDRGAGLLRAWERQGRGLCRRDMNSLRRLTIVLCGLLVLVPCGTVLAQDADDELGNWLIYNGTVRFSDKWSMFTEGQIRLWEVTSNLNEWFVRVAGHYDLSPKAVVGLGIMRSESWPFDSDTLTTEDRIYQHFAIRHEWARALFEHRYRIEQRWLDRAGEREYSNRFRYRLQVTTPVNRPTLEPGAWFVNFYEEIFLNFDALRTFDQNRLYLAGGYQLTKVSNLQIGLLWQARTSADFYRLQIFYTHNFNLHESD